ncbi:metallophosphoesterase [Aureimonas sp. AU20]|uniref:metallophosphoesterase family protein n=1 Tax=Aureimonas sp. AU20 TaxID=1349819 RepID=UPI00072060F5|nr:metallophosphoesterase [Aureimonas sp. AU20]ALN71411.1 hypothetical protein M673_01730 [Aureimonas sp. AU20]
MRIVQISDTHLSPREPRFDANWQAALAFLKELQPDLVIHTGDLALDGADEARGEAELAHGAAAMAGLGDNALILPGNHDVGHFPGMAQPVNAERLERWTRLVGPDRFCVDRGGWRLVGLNALLFGQAALGGEEAACAAEAAQWLFLEAALDGRDGRPVAIFSHKPVFVERIDEGETGYWGLRPAERARFMALCEAHDVRLHASGHLHSPWIGQHAGLAITWAPSTAFVLGEGERLGASGRSLGLVLHELTPDGTVDSRLLAVPGLEEYDFSRIGAEIYPADVGGVDAGPLGEADRPKENAA